MVRGFAPGYVAVTMTDGGTTSGYSLTGSFHSEMAPTTRMSTDSTPAKIGRVMKKREMFMAQFMAQFAAVLAAGAAGSAATGMPGMKTRA